MPARHRRWMGPLLLLGASLSGPGCTSVLGIDGTYELGTPGASTGSVNGKGGQAGAGSGGTAGATGGTAGATGGNGGAADGGVCTGHPSVCGAAAKCCAGVCVEPAPLTGCSMTDCNRCPPPPSEGVAVCIGTVCGIACNPGYVQSGSSCVPQGTGGAGAGGGTSSTGGGTSTGGTTAKCVASSCPGCPPVGPFGCCKNDGTCGCTWAPGAVCY